jgi:hypothetical protein
MRRTINIPYNDVKPAMNRSAEKQPNSIYSASISPFCSAKQQFIA